MPDRFLDKINRDYLFRALCWSEEEMRRSQPRKKRISVLTDAAVFALAQQAVAELKAKTEALDAIIHFRKASWLVDQEAGIIVFERKDGIKATAPVQIIGTYNTADQTWLWAWDHPSVVEPLRHDAKAVWKYGRRHSVEALTSRKIVCQESDCWKFTALACKLCGAQGAYRGPVGDTRVYVTFGEIELSC